MSISVLIPAYDAAATLARALDSIAAQDAPVLEIIVVDDGSADATAAVASGHGAPGLRLIRHERNKGSSAALNSGIAAALGDWIAFLDADDEWLPGKLTAQHAALRALPSADICATAFETVDAEGRLLFRYGEEVFPEPPALFWKRLLRESAIAKPSVLARRSALEAAGPFDTALPVGEDQDMWLRLAARAPVAYVHGLYTRVHAGAGSLTRIAAPYRERDLLLPMIERHLEQLWGRLDEAEARAIRAERRARAGRNLCDSCRGDWAQWRAGVSLLLQAARDGHAPLESFAKASNTAPLVQCVKARYRMDKARSH